MTRRRAAFTLAELAIVVLVLGIIAAVSVPKVIDITHDAEVVAVARQLQILADATEQFYIANGEWPNNALPGRFPADFEGYVQPNAFGGSPLGGQWDWNGPGTQVGKIGPNVVIRGTLTGSQAAAYQQIDELLDDGDLTNGEVQNIYVRGYNVLQFILADDN